MYFKFVHPTVNDQPPRTTLIEAPEAVYSKHVITSEKVFKEIAPPNYNADTMLIEQLPSQFDPQKGCGVVVLQYIGFNGSEQWRIAPNSNLFIMNEAGKTIDSVLCFLPEKGV